MYGWCRDRVWVYYCPPQLPKQSFHICICFKIKQNMCILGYVWRPLSLVESISQKPIILSLLAVQWGRTELLVSGRWVPCLLCSYLYIIIYCIQTTHIPFNPTRIPLNIQLQFHDAISTQRKYVWFFIIKYAFSITTRHLVINIEMAKVVSKYL